MDRTQLKFKLNQLVDELDDDHCPQFAEVINALSPCYRNKDLFGVLITANELSHEKSLLALNAKEEQVHDLLMFMVDALVIAENKRGPWVN